MSKMHPRMAPVNSGLPLFDHAAARQRRHHHVEPFPVAWLRARHPLSPRRARLLLELAGFPTEAH